MSNIKSIYNSTSLACLLELLWISLAVRLDSDFVDYQISHTSGDSGLLTMTARTTASDGRVGIYSGTAQFPFNKMDIEDIFPRDLVYGGVYPVTFERMREYLDQSYDYRLEEFEFYQNSDATQHPLGVGDMFDAAPNVSGDIYLRTTPTAARWRAGSTVRIHLTG